MRPSSIRSRRKSPLSTHAWANRVGLSFHLLARESYGLLVRAADLGDARVVRLCETAQSASFGERLAAIPGYDPSGHGDIRYDQDPGDSF